MSLRWCSLLCLLCCARREDAPEEAAPLPVEASSAPSAPASSAPKEPKPTEQGPVVLIAGGDVDLARIRGQRLLREPGYDDFATVRPLLAAADLRFVNLEHTISDQGGETQSPISQLVFTAPPQAAPALARAGIDVVSLANNHAWDYGKEALLETFTHLDAAKIAYVGAGPTRAAAHAPLVVERRGLRIAFVAVTAVWNQELEPHPGHELVANAETESLVASVEQARASADVVIVSHHGGYEYVDRPHPGTLALADAAMAAGADAFIGHHPHVIQRAGFVAGKPVFYSIGNLLMRMVTGKPWTQFGMFARLTLTAENGRAAAIGAEICPLRIHGFEPIPLAADPQRELFEKHFRGQFERLLDFGARERPDTATTLGEFGADGCAPLTTR